MSRPILNFICPHPDCGLPVIVDPNEINCAIFRHGVCKKSGLQIPPHAPKVFCDKVFNDGLIYGCGKPFKLVKKDENIIAEICDYI